jgi:hypothetical protein
MLFLKLGLASFRVMRVPPYAQCALTTALAFTLPSQFGCLTTSACASGADARAWVETRPLLQPLLSFLFMGAYEDAWDMYSSIMMRYYVLFAVQCTRHRTHPIASHPISSHPIPCC